jgi:integrase
VLTDDEIRSFWCGCDALGWPFGPLFQLCLLLGQRSHKETGGMEWPELDLENRLWHLPGSRTKNSRPNDLHLSRLALKVIECIPRHEPLPGKPDFCFSTTRCGPVTGFDSAVKRLRAMMRSDGWTVHDLRRTCSTNMGRLDIDQHVIYRVMNHTMGGVRVTYNRYGYMPQRMAALEAWSQFIEKLIEPKLKGMVLRRPGSNEDLPLAAE